METELTLNEIEDSTNRISHLVGVAEQHSHLARAPFEVADVHDLLDSTLVMLAGKIGSGIQVVKEYDGALPKIPAYPGGWTPITVCSYIADFGLWKELECLTRVGVLPVGWRAR